MIRPSCESTQPCRRDFLRHTLALATAAASPLAGTAIASTTKFIPTADMPFKVGLQSYSLRAFPLAQALSHSKSLGVHFWESFRAHIPPDPKQAAEFRKQCEAEGVKVIGFGVSAFTKDHEKNREIFEFGKAIGLDYLSADPAPDSFDSLDKLVEEYGIAIGIHNHGPGHAYAKIDTIAAAIKDHHPKIGCCIDTGHFLRSNEDPVRAVEVFDTRIFGVHLKDVKDSTKFTILGEGDLRTIALLAALAKRKYSYCLAIEYEENEKDPIDDIRQCLVALNRAWSRVD
jgi:sugar phosphate isomerase/epimerase